MHTSQKFGAKILHNPSLTMISEILAIDYPEFKSGQLENLENGHNNYVYCVNGKYIFRFPIINADDIDREVRLLRALRGKVSIPHPVPIYIGKEYSYMGYEKLAGVNPTREFYKVLPEEQRLALADDVAQFIFEMQGSFSVSEATALGLRELELNNDEPVLLEEIMKNSLLDTKVINICLNYIRKYRVSTLDSVDQRVMHRDLVTNNTLVDPISGRLAAVLDFGNAGVGNLYLDFASVFRNNRIMGKHVVESFNKKYNADISMDLTRIFASIIEIHHLEKPADNREHQRAITRLTIWSDEITFLL